MSRWLRYRGWRVRLARAGQLLIARDSGASDGKLELATVQLNEWGPSNGMGALSMVRVAFAALGPSLRGWAGDLSERLSEASLIGLLESGGLVGAVEFAARGLARPWRATDGLRLQLSDSREGLGD